MFMVVVFAIQQLMICVLWYRFRQFRKDAESSLITAIRLSTLTNNLIADKHG